MTVAFVSRLPEEQVRRWCDLLSQHLGGEIVQPADALLDDASACSVDVAVIADSDIRQLSHFSSLALVHSTWAGVDALLQNDNFPRVSLARLIDPKMAADMAGTILGHVMAAHLGLHTYRQLQAMCDWQPQKPRRATDRKIGFLGAGEMARTSAALLRTVGFPVTGWGRRERVGVEMTVSSGDEGLENILRESEILVNLLPLTEKTVGILNHSTLRIMPRGAVLINVARGAHLVIPHLIDALDSGQLSHAVLDVFDQEPLSSDDPLWLRNDITITPHIAASTDALSASQIIAENIMKFRTGKAIRGLIGKDDY